MTKEDINDIINAICPNDEDYEKPCISPKYLRQELEQLALDQRQWYKEPTTKNDLGVDCISRDSALKALDYDIKCFEFKRGVSRHMDDIAKLLNTIYETQVNNIKALPSATPQEPVIRDNGVKDELNRVKDELEPTTKNGISHRTIIYTASDCISRQAVIDMTGLSEWFDSSDSYNEFVIALSKVPSVTPQEPRCKECKWWKDSDGEYRRGCGAESQCPINRKEVFEGNGYCFLFEPQESEVE